MTSDAAVKLSVGELVAGRFRVTEALPSELTRPAFVGEDTESGAAVLLFAVTEAEAVALRPIVAVEHAHLARVFAVTALADGTAVLVSERVRGPALSEVLRQVTHETPIEAARSTLRVADAVSVIHHAGGTHGCLRPAAVVVAPEGHPPPRLVFAPPLLEASPFRTPERGLEGPPSIADDTWAVAALLFVALVGRSPPVGGITNDEALVSAQVDDAELRTTLVAALAPDAAARSSDLQALRRALARWFVATAGEETPSIHALSQPPPLPPGSAPRHAQVITDSPQSRAFIRSRPRTHWSLVGAGAVFIVAIAIAGGVSWWLAHRPATVVEVPKPPVPASASASAASIDLGDVPVTGDEGAATGNEMATCVAGYLPPGAFGKAPDLGWICAEKSPLVGAPRLRAALVSGRPEGQVTDAMKLWSRFDWYEYAAYSVIRAGCCVDAPPLELLPPSAGCGELAIALGRLGADFGAGRSVEASLQAYSDAATCEAKATRAAAYRQKGPPTSAGAAAFQEYLKAIGAP